jgi:hypothetical protein
MRSANDIISKNLNLFKCLMEMPSPHNKISSTRIDDINQEGQGFVNFLLRNKLLMRFYTSVTFENLDLKNETFRILTNAIKTEKQRQENLISVMIEIRNIFSDSDVDYVVIKTIDGYPDIGKDIDIAVLSNYEQAVRELMKKGFKHTTLPFIRKNCKKFYKKKNGFTVTVDLYDKRSTLIGETINLESIQNSKETFFGEVGMSSVPVPSPEASFLIKLDELYLNGQLSLGDMCTLVNLSTVNNFDWEYVLAVVEAAGTSPGLFYVLLLLNHNLEPTKSRSDLLNALNLNHSTESVLTHFSKPDAFPTKIAPAVILHLWASKFLRAGANGKFLNSLKSFMIMVYLLCKNARYQSRVGCKN